MSWEDISKPENKHWPNTIGYSTDLIGISVVSPPIPASVPGFCPESQATVSHRVSKLSPILSVPSVHDLDTSEEHWWGILHDVPLLDRLIFPPWLDCDCAFVAGVPERAHGLWCGAAYDGNLSRQVMLILIAWVTWCLLASSILKLLFFPF